MNVVAAQGIVEMFGQLGFRNMQYEPLWMLGTHVSSANNRVMLLTTYSSMHDVCLAHLLFGMTDIPAYIVTNFENPFSSFIANNVTILNLEEASGPNTARIVELFSKKTNFMLVFALSIASERKIHSSYFFIAQKLRLKMFVSGFDHFEQSCLVSDKLWPAPSAQMSYSEFQKTHEVEILAQLREICPLEPSKHVNFDMAGYRSKHPEFTTDGIQKLSLHALQQAVSGNTISRNEALAILGITAVIIIVFVLVYIFLVPSTMKTDGIAQRN